MSELNTDPPRTATLLDNPIAYVQLKLGGGRSAWWWATLAPAVALAVAATIAANVGGGSRAYWGISLLALVVAAVLTVLVAPGKVAGAVRKDRDADMLESHRLMPIPAHVALAGYAAGAAGPLMAGVGVLLVGGATLRVLSGNPLGQYLAAVALLAPPALVTWSLALVNGFGKKGAGWLVWVFVWPVMFTSGVLLQVFPGLAVMLSPLLDETVTLGLPTTVGEFGDVLPLHLASLGLSAAVAGVLATAAARRWYDDDAPAVGPLRAAALLVIWGIASLVGTAWFEDLVRDYELRARPATVVAASVGATLVLGLGLLVSAAAGRRRARDAAAHGERASAGWPVPAAGAVLLAIAAGQAVAMSAVAPGIDIGATAVVVAAAAIAAAGATAVVGAVGRVGAVGGTFGLPLFMFVLLAWCLPVFADRVLASLAAAEYEATLISGLSPAGAAIGTIEEGSADWLLLAPAAAVAAAAWVVYGVLITRDRGAGS